MRRIRRRVRSLVALVTLIALALGIPALLVGIAGWPFPKSVPDIDRVTTALRQNDIPAEVVINSLAVIVWIAWLQLMWALLWELSVNVGRTGRGRAARPAPLVASPIGSGIARLVALVLSIGVVVSSTPTPVLARPAIAATVPVDLVPGTTISHHVEPRSSAIGERWRVEENDTLWDIAEEALGDGARAGEILALNSNTLSSPRDVRTGQVLRLPTDARVPQNRQIVPANPSTVADPISSPTAVYLPEEAVTIVRGDTLWDISERRLSVGFGTEPTGLDILHYLDEVIALNDGVVEDPNLIYPGEVFTFPAVGDPPVAPAPEPEVLPADSTVAESPPSDSTALPPEPPTSVPEAIPATLPTAPRPTAPTPEPTSNEQPATTVAPEQTSPTSEDSPASTVATPPVSSATDLTTPVEESAEVSWPWIGGVTGSAFLASGLLLTYRRRRARMDARDSSYTRRAHGAEAGAVDALLRAADVPLVRWANHEIAELARRLKPNEVRATPVAVQVSAEHGLELLWDSPNPNAPRPWEAADGGWSWRILYDPDVPLRSVPDASPVPGLVSIGQRDESAVLVNLEALGSLAVTGDAAVTTEFVRSLVFELGSSEELSNCYVHVVGAVVEGVETLPRVVRHESPPIDDVRSIVHDNEHASEEASVAGTFGLRLSGEADGREVTVVVASADDDVDELLAAAAPHRGVAVVIVGAASTAARLQVDSSGLGRLEQLGLTIQVTRLQQSVADSIVESLEESIVDEETDPSPGESAVDVIDPLVTHDTVGVPASRAREDSEDWEDSEEWEAPAPELVVRVLGPPRVDQFPSLGRLNVGLVAYLACHGGRATEDQVINAVWGGRAIERASLWNRISKARSVLGRHIPAREQGTTVVRLAEGAMTDVQLLRVYAERAADCSSGEAIALLRQGLEWVTGVPFDAPGYEWAYEEQLHAEASHTIEDASLRLVELALEAREVDSARFAVSQGLKALRLNERLYRARMQIEAHVGNRAGIRAAYDELAALVMDLDDGCPSEPTTETKTLLAALLGSDVRRSA